MSGGAAANKRTATAEALRLFLLAKLPAGSTPVNFAPPGLGGPALGSVHTSSLIDHFTIWRVPLSYADAVAWAKAQAPASMLSGGDFADTYGTTKVDGSGYSEPDTAAWQQAQLEIGVGSDTAITSYVRVDGVAIWLDPVPLPDLAPQPQLRVSVSTGCPPTDEAKFDVTNSGPGLDVTPLPAGTPSAAIVCYYPDAGTSNGDPTKLTIHQLLDAPAAARLAAVARAVPTTHVDDLLMACPKQDGGAVVLAFAYPGRADVDLYWRSGNGGCGQDISNGEIWASADGDFISAVEAALGSPVASPSPDPVVSPPASIAVLLPPTPTGGAPGPPLHNGSPAAS
jgi:hypothetical protein